MGPGGFPSLQNWCDPTPSGRVGSIPTLSRHGDSAFRIAARRAVHVVRAARRQHPRRRFRNSSASEARFHQNKLPFSPGRAFLKSFAFPGSAQLQMGRSKAATLFLVTEAGTVGMSLKSWNDLKKAKDARKDTVVTPVLDNDGKAVIDSLTGQPKVTVDYNNPNLVGRIKARRTHLEDWIAAVVFNHLFAGADAYVAANLSDFNTNVQVTSTDQGLRFMARVAW